ncbi:hypothetical protein Droror1_Dr00028013 [Drosera rotundifolia]
MLRVALFLVTFLFGFVTAANGERVSGPHIADVNILLPPKMTRPVEYRLQGTDGCFKWSWDHHEILSVIPEYNISDGCSTSARLKSIAPYSGRKEAAVYAADLHTGIVIRCKVFIDILSRIQIFHNSVTLDLDGLATLRVLGFDNEDNVFSSLVGLQFMWRLIPKTEGSLHYLAHVPLKESPLGDLSCDGLKIQMMLEDHGVFSDLFMVKGIGIGVEAVFVHLFEPQYEHMEHEIVLTVAEAMSLDPPSPVFVVSGALVRYILKVVHGDRSQVVTLPSPFHRWSALNSSVAQVDSGLGATYALSMGETSVMVEDTRIGGNMQMSTFHVVLVHTLRLYILPLFESGDSGDPIVDTDVVPFTSRWYLVSGRKYLIQMKAFSHGPLAHEIYITENEEVKLHYDQSDCLESYPVLDAKIVKYGWRNSRILHATSLGLGQLSVSLTCSCGHPGDKQRVDVIQEVMVCDQVKLRRVPQKSGSSIIILPWAPGVYQEVELEPVGGCASSHGDYNWFSSDMEIVTVSDSGVLRAKKLGRATVKVISAFSSLNFDEVMVEVLPPSSMVMLPYFPVEVVVGSYLQAAVTMKASTGDYFFRCDAFRTSIKWNTGSESFMIVNSTTIASSMDHMEITELSMSAYGPPCTSTTIYAVNQNRAMLHAALLRENHYFDKSVEDQVILKASVHIASYSPLQVRQTSDGSQFGGYGFYGKSENLNRFEKLEHLYLVPGTCMDVELLGGPERWGNGVDSVDSVNILCESSTDCKDGVSCKDCKECGAVHLIATGNANQFRLFCIDIGTFIIAFRRGNLEGVEHLVPVVVEVHLLLECSFPASIVVLADESVNSIEAIESAIQADRVPEKVCAAPIIFANGRTIRVASVGISTSGYAFANSSSLPLNWELINCNELMFWDNASDLEVSAWEKFLVLQNKSGRCTVRATIPSIPDDILGHSASSHDGGSVVITDAVQLQLVSSLRVFPEHILLFVNPDAKMNLSVIGGSFFIDAAVNDSQVVEVSQMGPKFHCSELNLTPKSLGTALVTVYDIGLIPPMTASAVVEVSDIDWIKINSGEELSMMEGSLLTVELLVGNNDGITFHPSQYRYISILVHVEDHIVDLINGEGFPIPRDGYVTASNFTLHGTHLGVTTLFVSVRQQSGHQIMSQQIMLEVYALPAVHPTDIFLVPGASFVLTLKGGPTVGSSVEYVSGDGATVLVQRSSGQVSAIYPGNTTVIATVYGRQGTIICEACCMIRVGVPNSVILNAQSQKLAVGRDLPIFPALPEGDMFSFYGLCKNCRWSIEDEKILSFGSLSRNNLYGLLPSGGNAKSDAYSYERQFDCMNLLYGRSAGWTKVSLGLTCDFVSDSFARSVSYNVSTSIWVVPNPPLSLGIPITWILPPHYTTSDLLALSSDIYESNTLAPKGVITYSLLGHHVKNNREVSKVPIAIDGSKIKTTTSSSLACIQTEDLATARLEIASCVRVAEVAQVRIRRLATHAIDLAVGSEVVLPVNYFDDLGNPFHEAHNVALVDSDTNFNDIVRVDFSYVGDGILKIKALRAGKALVRVRFKENPLKSDYLMLSVGVQIYPQNPVLQRGARLNFSIDVSGPDELAPGKWLSANGSVIAVDSSGKAVAVGEGTSLVIFQSSNLTLQTTVSVLKGSIIIVEAPKEVLTNINVPPEGYKFSVLFSSHKLQHPGRYDCRVEPAYVGFTKPWRDLDTGETYCLFFPYSPEHLAYSTPKLKGMRPDISISVHVFLNEAHDMSGSASVLFIGGFSILERDKVVLTRESNRSLINIVGNTDINIHWRDGDQLFVGLVQQEGSGISGFAQYEVKALGGKTLKDKIMFELPSNGQTLEVDVNYDPGEGPTSRLPPAELIDYVYLFVCFFALIVILFAAAHYLDEDLSTHPATPSRTAPATPAESSPLVVNEESPRTPPQPFIDYVRRTIDETPYYRRVGRRSDPQNTY